MLLAIAAVFVAGLLFDPAAILQTAWACISGGLGRDVQFGTAGAVLAAVAALLFASRRRPAPQRAPKARVAG